MRRLSISILLVTASFILSSCDQDEKHNKNETILNFTESSGIDVMRDNYTSTLRYEVSGNEVEELQNKVNKMMQFAKQVTEDKSLKVSTGSYRVNQKWNQTLKKYSEWTAYQEIIIDSPSKEPLLLAIKNLQESGFLTKNLNSYLSKEKRDSYKNQLTEEVLERVKKKAELVAKNLDKQDVNITSIKINPSQNHYFSSKRNRQIQSNSVMSNPVVEPSEENVSVTISVTILLKK